MNKKLNHIDLVSSSSVTTLQNFSPNLSPILQSNVPGWHLNIPKIIHFYWGGKLTFLRYVSIYSCSKHNPDWKIKLHVPEILGTTKPTWTTLEQKNITEIQKNTTDYMSLVEKINGLEIVRHNFSKYGFSDAAHEVHKSDLLRWVLLSTEGGIWSDSDILYHQPMCVMTDNKPENSKYNTGICRYDPSSHAIGFLMANQNNTFFKRALEIAKSTFQPGKYQIIGSIIFNKHIKSIDGNVMYINPNTVYSITDEGIIKFLSDKTYIQNYREAIGFHWYGGHSQISKIEESINHTNYQNNNTFLGKLVRLAVG
jgi:hypothetical protein